MADTEQITYDDLQDGDTLHYHGTLFIVSNVRRKNYNRDFDSILFTIKDRWGWTSAISAAAFLTAEITEREA